MYREYTLEFLAQRSMVQLSFTMLTLGVISALAMILAAVGLKTRASRAIFRLTPDARGV